MDSCYYNFRCLEKRHYYSPILKHAIIIFRFPQICHRIRMDTAWAQLQAYTKTYTSSQPLSPVTDTRAPHVIFFFLLSSSSLAERVDDDGKKQQQHAAERSSRPGRLVPRCRRASPAREPTRPQQPLALAWPQLCAVQQNIQVRFGVHIPAMEF